MRQVYLDNAATTPLYPQVIEAMKTALEQYGNPSSLHHLGAGAEQMLAEARGEIAKLLKVSPGNIIFTSGGTEANNLAIKGTLAGKNRGILITSSIEHPSVLSVFARLEREGWKVLRLPVYGQGVVLLDKLEAALREPTALVSIMAVNNEIGTVQPLQDIVALVRARQPRAVIHVDAVQALGKIELEPARLGVDLMSVSAHKIHGPKGVGALYAARPDTLTPLLDGGGQEGGLRSGTENIPGIVGFGRAVMLTRQELARRTAKVARLRERFVQGLQELPCIVVSPARGVPHIVAVSFPGYRGEILLQALSGKGVYVSTGAACSGKKGNLSHVAEALGLDDETVTGMLRFSFSALNTEEEIDYALAMIRQVLAELAFIRGRRRR